MTPTTLAHVANHFIIVSGYVAGCVFAIWIGARSKRRKGRRFIRAKNDTLTFTPGPVVRSNCGDVLATPKPVIVPKPQPMTRATWGRPAIEPVPVAGIKKPPESITTKEQQGQ